MAHFKLVVMVSYFNCNVCAILLTIYIGAELNFSGHLRLGIHGGYLNLDEFETIFSMKQVKSNIEGIMGGGPMGDFYNQLLETLIPELLVTYEQEVTDFVRDTIMKPVNKILNTMTLSDLIGMLKEQNNFENLKCIVD